MEGVQDLKPALIKHKKDKTVMSNSMAYLAQTHPLNESNIQSNAASDLIMQTAIIWASNT